MEPIRDEWLLDTVSDAARAWKAYQRACRKLREASDGLDPERVKATVRLFRDGYDWWEQNEASPW